MLLKKRWFRRSIGLLLSIGVLVIGIRRITADPNLREIDTYFSFAASPDRSLLATTSGDKITLWRLPALTVEREISSPAMVEPRTIAWRADGQAFAMSSGKDNDTVVIYDLGNTTVSIIVDEKSRFITKLAWSPDAQWLAIGYGEAQIDLLHVPDGHSTQTLHLLPKKILDGHSNFVTDLTFDATGQMLISGSYDGMIRQWRVDDGTLLDSFPLHGGDVKSMALSPDGQTLATGAGNTVRLWNLNDGTWRDAFMRHKESVNSVAWSPDGQWLVSGSGDYHGGEYGLYESKHRTVQVWQASDGRSLFTFGGQEAPVAGVAFSADGQWVISGATWDGLRRWKVK
ncbi:MAG: WD40 repeat domain-containing protein [Herpetosiphonaceae bacterium]|nr:WD40 repeat domain-containing protein [Herpetosiphonaceae bacterium]